MLLNIILTLLFPRFNFPEETFSRIGQKVAKTCSREKFSATISYNTYNIQ